MSGKSVETDLDKGVLDNAEWVRRWQVDDTPFNQGLPDPFLDQYEERMFAGKTKRVFAPLCGKAVDLIWMYQRGHAVEGVEIAEQPVKDLFEESKTEYQVTEIENVGKLYKSKDNRLQIYVADLFDLSVDLCGQYDLIWDSKSLVAINVQDHARYVELLLSLMKKDGGYYLNTLEYDPDLFPGPPHTMPDKLIRDLFEDRCHVELLSESKETNDGEPQMSEEELAKLTREHRIFMTAPYIYWRWYYMKFK